jgi:hypothetical protein
MSTHVGGVRVAALAAAAPLLQDAVVTAHDQPFIGLLAWPNVAAGLALDALRSSPRSSPPITGAPVAARSGSSG